MSAVISLSNPLIEDARLHAKASGRSVSEQIEYWTRLGKAVEDNPDLGTDMIQDLLAGIKDIKLQKLAPYHFGILR